MLSKTGTVLGQAMNSVVDEELVSLSKPGTQSGSMSKSESSSGPETESIT